MQENLKPLFAKLMTLATLAAFTASSIYLCKDKVAQLTRLTVESHTHQEYQKEFNDHSTGDEDETLHAHEHRHSPDEASHSHQHQHGPVNESPESKVAFASNIKFQLPITAEIKFSPFYNLFCQQNYLLGILRPPIV